MLSAYRFHAALIVSLMAGAALAGCETPDQTLLETEERFKAARADQALNAYAPESLATAQRMLKMASEAEPSPRRYHYTYMTQKTLDIAEAVAAQRQAEQGIKNLQNSAVSSLGPAPIPAPIPTPAQPAARNERETNTADTLEQERLDPPAEDRATPPHLGTQTSKRPFSQRFVLTPPNIFFDSGKSTLSPGSKRWIDPIVERLHNDLRLDALIEGYSDDTGSHDSNLDISLARAKAIKSYLVGQGIAPTRIETLGHGAQYPIAGNDTAEGRRQNRRIEIVLYRIERQPESIEHSMSPALGPPVKY